MISYVIRRCFILIPTLIGITLISFLILQLVPGDPARMIAGVEANEKDIEGVRHQLGLDKPILLQYGIFLKNLARGNLGESIRTKNSVVYEIWPRLINTVRLALASLIISLPIGLIAGTIAAIRQNTIIDYVTMVCVLLGISTPTFWSGLILVLIFSVHLGWFPSGGGGRVYESCPACPDTGCRDRSDDGTNDSIQLA